MTFLGDVRKDRLKFGEACRLLRRTCLTRPPFVSSSSEPLPPRPGFGSASGSASSASPPALTQTDLAGDRFSKEYVSQIERGKTRPTRETIDWLAERLGVDAGFLANGVSADERGRVDAALARADALLEARRNDEALEEFEQHSRRRAGDRAARARGARPLRRGDRAHARAARSARRSRCSSARARSPRATASPTSSVPTSSSGSASPATSSTASRRRSACSTRRSSSPSAPRSRRTSSARTSSRGARAATAAAATSRPRARTSSARSSSPKA